MLRTPVSKNAVCPALSAPSKDGSCPTGDDPAAGRDSSTAPRVLGWECRLTAWLERAAGVPAAHITQRHDSAAFVLLVLTQPTWLFSLPFSLLIWGHFGAWRRLFWIPCPVFAVVTQIMCCCGLYFEPEAYLYTRVGQVSTLLCVSSFTVMMLAPLAMRPFCDRCLPLHDIIWYTVAVFTFTIAQVRLLPVLPRTKSQTEYR